MDSAPPRYYRNPETGLFERVPSSVSSSGNSRQDVRSRGDSLGPRGGSSPALMDGQRGQSLGLPEDRRAQGPRNVSASSYDDMLKNLDAMVTEQSQPVYNSRRPSQPMSSSSQRSVSRGGVSSANSLDFSQMDASLDDLLKGQPPPRVFPPRTAAGISPRGESRPSPRTAGSSSSEYAPSPSVNSTARAPASRMAQSRATESPVTLDMEALRGSSNNLRSRPTGNPMEIADERETERLRRDHERVERDRRALELSEAQQVAQRRDRVMRDPSTVSSSASMPGPLGDANVMDDRVCL
jgi:hypothetical protein